MTILGAFLFVVQVSLAIHAMKTGKEYWWIFLIIFVPALGCIIYFFVALLPDMQRSGVARSVGSNSAHSVDASKQLRQLQANLDISDTVRNRQALADAYIDAGAYQEAVEMYQSCLRGAYADDAAFLLGLSRAYFLGETYPEAYATLEQLRHVDANFKASERHLMLARTCERQEDVEQALQTYENLVKYYPGEEARCRYAALLKKHGQEAKARAVFEEIVTKARQAPLFYQQAQKKWVDIAHQQLV